MEVLQEVIYTQNLDLLHRIADDMYIDECDKQTFIYKYHKKNFSQLIPIKKNNNEKHLKMIKHCVK